MIEALSDLIENKIADMSISDREDLRERVTLERALCELRGAETVQDGVLKNFSDIPRRGRRRKVSEMLVERH